ncbi:MAG TPA: tRNA (N6-isopentenyl adenosine(37)-C2)-methylthiotransferase MiaB, partial [Candidatus Eisenbacteria bacterium]
AVLAGRFKLEGCHVVATPEEADIILVNTCAVRENAEERVFGRIGELKRVTSANGALLGVTGCMAQRLGGEILERAKHVDLVVGTGAYGKVFELLEARRETGQPQIDLSFGQRFTEIERPRLAPGEIKTFLSIMEGCNKSCSYCIVPYTRGKERYKSLGMIRREAEELVARGVKEITLLGQNINSWRDGKWRFADVLTEVNRTPGLERIRFTTSHPINTDEKMLEAMAAGDKVCETLQLPIQSGSDRILALMRRGYTRASYDRLIARGRELMPNLAVTTDLIVGFPGETNDDFAATVRAMDEIRFDSAFMFAYSERRGTRACAMPDPVPAEVAAERLQTIIALQRRHTEAIGRSRIGSTEEVLIEALAPRRPDHVIGKSRTFKPVVMPGPLEWIGTTRTVSIRSTQGVTLFGEALPIGTPAAVGS